MTSTPLQQAIDAASMARFPNLVEVRHTIHRNPELSNREANTAALIVDRLTALGLDDVRTNVAGHGVVGVLRGRGGGSRTVGLRADMDALPVKEASGVDFASTVVDDDYPGGPFPVAHACGHDCHTATVLTAAAVLADVRDELPGTVAFIFQPAEEGPPIDEDGGAQLLVDSGRLDDLGLDFVFGMHVSPLPKGIVGYASGTMFAASCLVRITVSGRQVHGATPWLGIDPLPAVAGIISGIAQTYRQVDANNPITVSIGHIEDVGRFNIIGDEVKLFGTIRCRFEGDMELVQQSVRRLAEHQAAGFDCLAGVEFLQPVRPVVNQQRHIDAIAATVERVVGADRVFGNIPAALNYDDISALIDRFGGAYLTFGVQDTAMDGMNLVPAPGGRGMVPNHNPAFYADDDCLIDSLRIHAHVAADLLVQAAAG